MMSKCESRTQINVFKKSLEASGYHKACKFNGVGYHTVVQGGNEATVTFLWRVEFITDVILFIKMTKPKTNQIPKRDRVRPKRLETKQPKEIIL